MTKTPKQAFIEIKMSGIYHQKREARKKFTNQWDSMTPEQQASWYAEWQKISAMTFEEFAALISYERA